MANKNKMLSLISKGSLTWNQWRRDKPSSTIDLSGVNLSGADIRNMHLASANLSRANLSGANLSGTDLADAILTGANLSGAKLDGVKLSRARLNNANLSRADLTRAVLSRADFSSAILDGSSLSNADLTYANFSKSRLEGANLSKTNLGGTFFLGANLSRADFSMASVLNTNLCETNLRDSMFNGATINGANFAGGDLHGAAFINSTLIQASFSSKSSLNSLSFPLTQEQIIGCVFVEDEEAKREGNSSEKPNVSFSNSALIFRFEGNVWTPLDFSLLFMSLQVGINRLQYLLTTSDSDIGDIKAKIAGPCYQNEHDTIRVKSLVMHSPPTIELAYVVETILNHPVSYIITGIASAIVLPFAWAKAFHELQSGRIKAAEVAERKLRLTQEQRKAEHKVLLPAATDCLPGVWGEVHADGNSMSKAQIPAPESLRFKNPVVEQHKEALLQNSLSSISTVAQWASRQGVVVVVYPTHDVQPSGNHE